MKKMIFAVLVALSIGTAYADPYVTASVGALTTGGTQAIAVGMDYDNGISAEVEYRNFNSNQASGNNLFVCDAVDPVTGRCVASHGEADTMGVKMVGVGVTAKLALTKNVYARLGAFYHDADVDETFAPSRGIAPASFTDTGFSPVVGMGVTMNGFAFEITSYGSISPTPEGEALAVGTSVSYTYHF